MCYAFCLTRKNEEINNDQPPGAQHDARACETSHLLALHPQKCMSMRMLNAIEKYMIDSGLLNEGEPEEVQC